MTNGLIAITGGSGFVGSHVVDALLGAGYEVRVIDPKPPAQPNVEWADVDMLDQDSVTDALKNAHAVFHLAAMADTATPDHEERWVRASCRSVSLSGRTSRYRSRNSRWRPVGEPE